MSTDHTTAWNAIPLFYQSCKGIKVFCSFNINWKSVPNFWSVELIAFSTTRNLVSSRNIQIQLMAAASKVYCQCELREASLMKKIYFFLLPISISVLVMSDLFYLEELQKIIDFLELFCCYKGVNYYFTYCFTSRLSVFCKIA